MMKMQTQYAEQDVAASLMNADLVAGDLLRSRTPGSMNQRWSEAR